MEYFEFDYDSPMTGGQILTQVYCWFVLWILVARWIKASGNTATRADDATDSNRNGTLEASSFHLFTSEDLGRGEITQESSNDNKSTILATPIFVLFVWMLCSLVVPFAYYPVGTCFIRPASMSCCGNDTPLVASTTKTRPPTVVLCVAPCANLICTSISKNEGKLRRPF